MNTMLENVQTRQGIGHEANAVDKDDQAYLARPMLDDWKVINEPDHINIVGPSTCYAEARLKAPIEDLLSLYRQVHNKAKELGVKISYKGHYRKRIEEGWQAYKNACVRQKLLFQQIRDQVLLIENRGLHRGTSDDAALHKLHALCGEYGKFHYRSSVISQMERIHRALEHTLESLDGGDVIQITL